MRFPLLIVICLAIASTALAQSPTIAPGSKIYIEPMNGFETYLAAAIEKKKVPVTLVSSKEAADFVVTGTNDSQKAGWAKIVFLGDVHSDEQASVSIVNAKNGEVAFAYAVNKKNSVHGEQTTAEACAKHLKESMEKAK